MSAMFFHQYSHIIQNRLDKMVENVLFDRLYNQALNSYIAASIVPVSSTLALCSPMK